MKEQRITPPGKLDLGLRELLQYKELFYIFTWRDIKVKYKQTFLGFAWVILQPLVMILIFNTFFGKALNVPSDGVPYPLFVFSGLLLWNVFSTGLTGAGNSMVSHANIIKKIYFPRLVIPMSSILVSVFDFFMAFLIYLAMVFWYDYSLDLRAFYIIPLALLLTMIATFGLGTLISALNVKYRDFRHALPFFVQTMLFLTPVIYPVSMFGEHSWLQRILEFNPMYAPITLMRSALLGQMNYEMNGIYYSIGASLILLVSGVLYFKRTEAYFADIA